MSLLLIQTTEDSYLECIGSSLEIRPVNLESHNLRKKIDVYNSKNKTFLHRIGIMRAFWYYWTTIDIIPHYWSYWPESTKSSVQRHGIHNNSWELVLHGRADLNISRCSREIFLSLIKCWKAGIRICYL